MYPLNAIIVCTDSELNSQIKRELSHRKASLEAEFTDVGKAIDSLRRTATQKRLVILAMGSIRDLDALRRLTTHFPGWPILTVVQGYDPSGSLGQVVIEIMRAGASNILSVPIVSEDFKEALDRISAQFVHSTKDAKVIAVAGATGGSGATTIALNLAHEIADRQKVRCILVDLSLRMGVLASHLNIDPTHSIIDLLRDTTRLDSFLAQQVLIKVTDNLEILAGPPKLLAPGSTSSHDLARVIDIMKEIADVIVLDLPCTYDDIYFDTLAAADEVILIGEQKLPSIRALKMVREALGRVGGTKHLVINQFDPKIKGFALDHLLKPLGVTTLHKVARDDTGLSAAMDAASTLRLASSRSPALADIVTLADLVMPAKSTTPIKPVGLFGRLSRAFANS